MIEKKINISRYIVYMIFNQKWSSFFVFEKCAYWGYNILAASQCSDLNGKGG